jgi:hypothetical protein
MDISGRLDVLDNAFPISATAPSRMSISVIFPFKEEFLSVIRTFRTINDL